MKDLTKYERCPKSVWPHLEILHVI